MWRSFCPCFRVSDAKFTEVVTKMERTTDASLSLNARKYEIALSDYKAARSRNDKHASAEHFQRMNELKQERKQLQTPKSIAHTARIVHARTAGAKALKNDLTVVDNYLKSAGMDEDTIVKQSDDIQRIADTLDDIKLSTDVPDGVDIEDDDELNSRMDEFDQSLVTRTTKPSTPMMMMTTTTTSTETDPEEEYNVEPIKRAVVTIDSSAYEKLVTPL